MARSSSFSFTNTTPAAKYVQAINLGVVDNYALTTDNADEAVLSNKTAGIDSEEVLTYRCRDIKNVNTSIEILNPAPVQSGVQYQWVTECVLVTTDSSDPTFRVDEPIVISTTIRHPKSANFDNERVAKVFGRHIGQMIKRGDDADVQDWRFEDLMRSAERPVED